MAIRQVEKIIKSDLINPKLKNGLNFNTTPTSITDSSLGYSFGSILISNPSQATFKVFKCIDSTVGAAKWVELDNEYLQDFAQAGKRFGDKINYTTFEHNGILRMEGSAEVWNDIIISGLTMAATATAPDIITLWNPSIKGYSFDGAATTESVSTLVEIPHDYDEGTDIDIHVHWCPVDGNAGNVKWNFAVFHADVGSIFQSVGAFNSTSAAAGQWMHTLSGTGLISIPTLKIGSILSIELYRNPTDVADTYGSDAAILSVGIHYKCDTMGSRSRTTKF